MWRERVLGGFIPVAHDTFEGASQGLTRVRPFEQSGLPGAYLRRGLLAEGVVRAEPDGKLDVMSRVGRDKRVEPEFFIACTGEAACEECALQGDNGSAQSQRLSC